LTWSAKGGGSGSITWHILGDSGSEPVTDGDSVRLVGGDGISTIAANVNATTEKVTIDADGTWFWFFVQADNGASYKQKIFTTQDDQDILIFTGEDGIETRTTATPGANDDTVWVGTDDKFLRTIELVGGSVGGDTTLTFRASEMTFAAGAAILLTGTESTTAPAVGPRLGIDVIRDPAFVDETKISSTGTGIHGGDSLVLWKHSDDDNRSKWIAGDGIRLDGESGSTASSDDPYIKISTTFDKSAIVAGREPGQYVGLQCVEMPDVRFEDVLTVDVDGRGGFSVPIDPQLVFVCEPNSIEPVSYVCNSPAVAGVEVIDGHTLKIEFSHSTPLPDKITVKVSGIRKGRAGRRFPEYTEAEATANNAFWQLWRQGATE